MLHGSALMHMYSFMHSAWLQGTCGGKVWQSSGRMICFAKIFVFSDGMELVIGISAVIVKSYFLPEWERWGRSVFLAALIHRFPLVGQATWYETAGNGSSDAWIGFENNGLVPEKLSRASPKNLKVIVCVFHGQEFPSPRRECLPLF